VSDQWVDADGTVRLTGTFVGGGSQAFNVLRAPVAFDTPGVVVTGVPLGYTPEVGELLAFAGMTISTAWNGTTPRGYIYMQGADPLVTGDSFLSGIHLSSADGPSGSFGFTVGNAAGFTLYPDVVSVSAPMMFVVDNNSGGDPGASQGEGEVILIFVPNA
jgi:hypothetical protein